MTALWHEGTNWYGRLQVLDISNPASPHPTGEMSMPGVWDVAVSGPYACVLAGTQDSTSWASSLDVIDISDPANPHRVGAYASAEPLGGLAISGQYAYVGSQSWSSWSSASELHVIDISNPTAPQKVGRCRLEGAQCHQVTVSGRYTFVAGDYGGLLVIDVSDPTRPRRISRTTGGQASGAAIFGRYVAVAFGAWEVGSSPYPEGLVILDMESPACLQRLSNLELPPSESEVSRRAVGVAVSGPHTYVASNGAECDSDSCYPSANLFHAIDTSDPTNPQLVGECYFHGDGGTTTIAISDQTAYVDDEGLWLNAVDLSDPAHPARVREIDLGRNGPGLAVSDGYVYVAGVSGDLGLFEVYNTGLGRIGRLQLSGRGSGIALAAPCAYVAGHNLEVIDISQPSNPQRVGGCPGLGGGWGGQIAILDGQACVVGDGMLRVFDISEATSPHLLGECPARGMDIALAGNYAYVADAGVEVFDIRDPAHPRRVGGNSAFDAYALAIADGRLHVAAGEQGLVILNLYEPPRFESLRLDAEGFQLHLRGVIGQMMRLSTLRVQGKHGLPTAPFEPTLTATGAA